MAETGEDHPLLAQIEPAPGKRPRLPRQRAEKRRIAPLGYLSKVGEEADEPLTAEQIEALIKILSKKGRALSMSEMTSRPVFKKLPGLICVSASNCHHRAKRPAGSWM